MSIEQPGGVFCCLLPCQVMDLVSGQITLIAEGHIASKLESQYSKRSYLSSLLFCVYLLRNVAFKNNPKQSSLWWKSSNSTQVLKSGSRVTRARSRHRWPVLQSDSVLLGPARCMWTSARANPHLILGKGRSLCLFIQFCNLPFSPSTTHLRQREHKAEPLIFKTVFQGTKTYWTNSLLMGTEAILISCTLLKNIVRVIVGHISW